LEIVVDDLLDLILQRWGKDQDGCFAALDAQELPFLQIGHSEEPRSLVDGYAPNLQSTMSIGVCFHDLHKAHAGRQEALQLSQVVPESG